MPTYPVPPGGIPRVGVHFFPGDGAATTVVNVCAYCGQRVADHAGSGHEPTLREASAPAIQTIAPVMTDGYLLRFDDHYLARWVDDDGSMLTPDTVRAHVFRSASEASAWIGSPLLRQIKHECRVVYDSDHTRAVQWWVERDGEWVLMGPIEWPKGTHVLDSNLYAEYGEQANRAAAFALIEPLLKGRRAEIKIEKKREAAEARDKAIGQTDLMALLGMTG